MSVKRNRELILLTVIVITTISLFTTAQALITYSWTWDKDVHFGLTSYDTEIGFDEDVLLNSFSFNSGTSLTFYNVYMGTDNVEEITLSTQTANMTITDLTSDSIDYSVSGSGTQTICLENRYPLTVRLNGVAVVAGMGYTYTSGTVTITGATSSASITFREEVPDNLFVPAEGTLEYTENTWYFRSDTWTVNTELGYQLRDTQSSTATYVESTSASLQNFTVGIELLKVDEDGNAETVTDYVVAKATQSGLTSGTMKTGTYTLSEDEPLDFNDAIQIKIYHQLGSGSETAKATYITDQLETNQLADTLWTVSYYVTVTEDAGTYYYRFYFGNSTATSNISNVQLADLDAWERGRNYLGDTDLIGFILNPYTSQIGQELAFGILFMIMMIPAYNRYRDIRPVIILFLLFGGVGGFFTAIIPSVGIQLSYVFLIIGIALMLYKLLR